MYPSLHHHSNDNFLIAKKYAGCAWLMHILVANFLLSNKKVIYLIKRAGSKPGTSGGP